MNEKVIKEFIERLEESAVYFQTHKSDIWSKELDKSREALLTAFREKQKEIEKLKKDIKDMMTGYEDWDTNFVDEN